MYTGFHSAECIFEAFKFCRIIGYDYVSLKLALHLAMMSGM